jgi:hypothetical protein
MLAKSCKIDRVSHFKDVKRVNHELVLIEVVFSSNSNKIKTFLQSDQYGPPSSSASILTMSSNGVKAKSIIFIPGNKTRNKESFDKRTNNLLANLRLVRTISLSERCSVAQLLVMLTVLHDCFQNYTVLNNEHFQYAGILCKMLWGEFGGIEGGWPGMHKFIKVIKPVPKELVKYHEAWKAFCDQVDGADQEREVSTLE